MPNEREPDDDTAKGGENFIWVAFLAPIVGAYAGYIGAAFRLMLEWVDRARDWAITVLQPNPVLGPLLVGALCGLATAAAASLVRRYSPYASGSGIPHAEAVLRGLLPQGSIVLIPVKFFGGLLAIGAGLALGREGPSVQMGATTAHLIGKVFRCNWADCRALLAAGAGAGLATAFNAPIAGAVFVLEELVGRFELRIAIAALGASATAISVSHLFLPNSPVFAIAPLPVPPPEAVPLCLVLGAVTGVLGIAYNRLLLATLAALEPVRPEIRAAGIGTAIGVLAFYAPHIVGGGDELAIQALTGNSTLTILSLIFALRGGLSVLSYAAGTPGGIFAPLLALGAESGLAFGLVSATVFPSLGLDPRSFAVVGTAALFTAVVRAPVTGIILITEMTADTTMLLPMLGACFVAMLVPTLARNPPIYDSLRELTLKAQKSAERSQASISKKRP